MFHAWMFQIATLEPMITGLQEALPKSIGLLPFDGGVTGT
jgi:cytoplasmic FMR1 interacting protein